MRSYIRTFTSKHPQSRKQTPESNKIKTQSPAHLDDASLDTAHGYGSNAANLVDILEGQAEGLVGGTLGGVNGVQSLQQGGSLVPGQVGRALNHVVALEAGDGHEVDLQPADKSLSVIFQSRTSSQFMSPVGYKDANIDPTKARRQDIAANKEQGATVSS